MSPTLTVPEIAKAAKEEVAHFITQIDKKIASADQVAADAKEEGERLRDIKRAMQSKTGTPSRARSGNGTRTATRRTTPTTRTRTTRSTTRRTRRGGGKTITAETVLGSMRRGVGFQTSEIAKTLGTTGTTARRKLKELEAHGKVKHTGTGAQSKWMMR